MKQLCGLIIILFPFLFFGCLNEPHNPSKKVTNDTIVPPEIKDTVSFDYFKSQFETTQLPIHFKPSYLLSHSAFVTDTVTKESDWTLSFIPPYQLEKWLIDTTDSTAELTRWYLINKKFLNDKDWNWFSIHYGFHFEENLLDYFVTYRYEQVSAVNGGGWTYFLHCFDENHTHISTQVIGEENYYTHVQMEDTDQIYYWQRHSEVSTVEINIITPDSIQVCEYYEEQMVGDLLEEQEKLIQQKNVTYDTLVGLTQSFPENCYTF